MNRPDMLKRALAQKAPVAPHISTLTGVVKDDRGGPIAGAKVGISTAALRQGVGIL